MINKTTHFIYKKSPVEQRVISFHVAGAMGLKVEFDNPLLYALISAFVELEQVYLWKDVSAVGEVNPYINQTNKKFCSKSFAHNLKFSKFDRHAVCGGDSEKVKLYLDELQADYNVYHSPFYPFYGHANHKNKDVLIYYFKQKHTDDNTRAFKVEEEFKELAKDNIYKQEDELKNYHLMPLTIQKHTKLVNELINLIEKALKHQSFVQKIIRVIKN